MGMCKKKKKKEGLLRLVIAISQFLRSGSVGLSDDSVIGSYVLA